MLLSDNLKTARTQRGLSQAQVAQRLHVSRQAVTKWENGHGMPDIENLTRLATLYDTTVDALLGGASTGPRAYTETIDLDAFERPRGLATKADAAIAARFPRATIIPLARRKLLTAWQHAFDFIVGAGTLELGNAIGDQARHYLVLLEDEQWLVAIAKNTLRAEPLAAAFEGRDMIIGDYLYRKGDPMPTVDGVNQP